MTTRTTECTLTRGERAQGLVDIFWRILISQAKYGDGWEPRHCRAAISGSSLLTVAVEETPMKNGGFTGISSALDAGAPKFCGCLASALSALVLRRDGALVSPPGGARRPT